MRAPGVIMAVKATNALKILPGPWLVDPVTGRLEQTRWEAESSSSDVEDSFPCEVANRLFANEEEGEHGLFDEWFAQEPGKQSCQIRNTLNPCAGERGPKMILFFWKVLRSTNYFPLALHLV